MNVARTDWWKPFGLVLLAIAGLALPARGQEATLSGFITDATNGQALELVNVLLRAEDDGLIGAVTNRDGLYLINRIPPGRYALQVSYIGYETHVDTLHLAANETQTLNVALTPDEKLLGEVIVQTERTTGAARITAGQQSIRPEDVRRIPTPDLSPDLAGYLTTIPGVVSTGDRGGQLFIRGGEPTQNLVQLDGMVVYQPFHLLGFYSAFPADILNRTDIYAGGYGSRYGGRISSVIDVWSRTGNKQRYAAAASVSPFISSLNLEGPIVPGHVSLLTSARTSMVEDGASRLIDRALPFTFNDVFAKLHADLGPRSRLSVSGLLTYDRGVLREAVENGQPLEEIRWRNEVIGLRYLSLPRLLPVATDLRVSHSRFFTEQNPTASTPLETNLFLSRRAGVSHTHLYLGAMFLGEGVDVEAGLEGWIVSFASDLGGLFQNVEIRRAGIDHLAFFVEPEFAFGRGLRVRPGLRMQFFHIRIDPFLEPRLRIVWNRGPHQISAAAGLYHQETVGLSDRRDATNVFTVWTYIPRPERRFDDVRQGRIPRALHAILGYQASPTPWLDLAVEGFYKALDNLFISEWSSFPRFTTRLQPAEGRSYGFDARLEVRRRPFYGSLNYGYSSTRYEAKQAAIRLWYGTESLRFRPPHDRRHQINALASLTLFGFDLGVRWNFGSGLPFNQAVGFDGFVLIDDILDIREVPGSPRVIYERPYNATLPAYHRLDLSLGRTFEFDAAAVTLQGSLINVYDRANVFYLDVFTLRRVNQLPFVPSLSLKVGIH
ncbi:hypothetical protein AWN76_011410 [Rhodothermaceae bacterium RA]|nr:hypothetical protein AWN76_011410 [Rhodothermaceae bacterium RA]